MQSLSAMNSDFESMGSDPPCEIWNEWLWGCDLTETVTVDCLLNRAHLLGILIARYRAKKEPEVMNVCINLPHMVYQNSKVMNISPRQLKDVIEDLQLHWTMYAQEVELNELTDLVDACLARFGYFNMHPSTYDDVGMKDSTDAHKMSVLCMRRMISTLCILYRQLDLVHRWEEPPPLTADVETIQEFHVQSSMDEFHKHMMHSDLPPAALLIYRQDFSGFYHCVSQVVFFHFPEYTRKAQLDLAAICSGDHPVHSLAPVMEMYPEIHLCYEDDTPKSGAWNWILMGKRLYLMDPEQQHVYYSGNLFDLMAAYLTSASSCPPPLPRA